MNKKLSERIAERATAKAQSRNAKNKAQFLSVRNEVEEALGENWTVKDIWETLHEEGAISFSYEAFRKHVNAWKNHKPEPQKNHQQEAAPPQITKSTELPGFTWNPIPNRGTVRIAS